MSVMVGVWAALVMALPTCTPTEPVCTYDGVVYDNLPTLAV